MAPEDSPSTPPADPALNAVRARIRAVADFPKPGVLFRDITPLLADAEAFGTVIEAMAAAVSGWQVDGLVAIESRGFVFGAALAQRLRLPLQLVRKPGKLPWQVSAIDYALEYGTDRLEIHADAVHAGGRYAIIDDVLATGGTAAATAALVRKLGGTPVGVAVLIELLFLDGRRQLDGLPVASLITY